MTDPKSKASPEDILVGGQAVIEGVMMRASTAIVIAVRKPDESIVIRREKLTPLARIIKYSLSVDKRLNVRVQAMRNAMGKSLRSDIAK